MNEHTFRFVVISGPEPDRVYPLVLEAMTIGRDPLADVVINDPEISRQHARLIRTETGYSIQDLGSTNGTFLDGARLTGESRVLTPGQIVNLGSTVSLAYESAEPAGVAGALMVAGPAIEPIPDPLGTELIGEPEESEVEDVMETPAEDAPAEEGSAAEEAAGDVTEPATDPFSDPAWKEALAPKKMPDFRFDDKELPSGASPLEPEPLPSFAAPAEPVPSFSSYQPDVEAPPPPTAAEPPKAKGNGSRRTLNVVLAIVAILILCCCGFFALMYFWLGDLILKALETASVWAPALLA